MHFIKQDWLRWSLASNPQGTQTKGPNHVWTCTWNEESNNVKGNFSINFILPYPVEQFCQFKSDSIVYQHQLKHTISINTLRCQNSVPGVPKITQTFKCGKRHLQCHFHFMLQLGTYKWISLLGKSLYISRYYDCFILKHNIMSMYYFIDILIPSIGRLFPGIVFSFPLVYLQNTPDTFSSIP